MSITLWIIGILVLFFAGVAFWLYKTCANTDGDMGQAFASMGCGGLAIVLALVWIILLIVKVAR